MDIQQMFFTSLQLLGFDASAMERKWRTPFNKDMFKLQNKKGFEVIMYFLFDKMNPTQCREEFRNCWPVQDKKQEQEFRRVVNRWLTDIAKDTESHLPRFASSLFLSPSGDKLYQLLTSFSRYIMVKQINASGYKQRNFLNYPILTPQNQTMGSVLVKAIKCGTIRHHRQALEHITQSVAVQEEWKQMASEQVKRYRGRSKSIRELEREKEVQLQKLLKRRPESDSLLEYDLEVENVRRAQKIQEVRDLWRKLDGCSRCSDRSTMEASLEAAHDNCAINAAELAVTVPDVLLRECEQEIQRRGVENIYEGGKLNLLSLLHLWNLSLHLLLEKLHKVGVPDFREDIPVISSQVHTHNAHLANLQSLRLKLEHEILPELKEKTAKLKHELDQIVFSSMSPDSVRMTSLGFGLMPPTPPVNFDPSDSKTPSNMAVNMMTAQQHAQPEHTPEAAMQIMESINKRAAGSGKHSSASFLIQGTPTGIPKESTDVKRRVKSDTLPIGDGPHVRKKVQKRQKAGVKPTGTMSRLRKASHSTKDQERKAEKQVSEVNSRPGTASQVRESQKLSDTSKGAISKVRSTKKSVGGIPLVSSRTREEKGLDSSELSSIPAHDLLANRIVDEIMSENSSPRENLGHHSEEDFLARDAFNKRDKLMRTPPGSRLENSYGPLSSTRIEGSRTPVDRGDRDKVTAKLFSPKSADSSLHQSNNDKSVRESSARSSPTLVHLTPHSTADSVRESSARSSPTLVNLTPHSTAESVRESSARSSPPLVHLTPRSTADSVRESSARSSSPLVHLTPHSSSRQQTYGAELHQTTAYNTDRNNTSRNNAGRNTMSNPQSLDSTRSSTTSGRGSEDPRRSQPGVNTLGENVTFGTPTELDPTPADMAESALRAMDVVAMAPTKEGATKYSLGIFDTSLEEGDTDKLMSMAPSSSMKNSGSTLWKILGGTLSAEHSTIQSTNDGETGIVGVSNGSELNSMSSVSVPDNIRCIEFKDGLFNEFLEKSPLRHGKSSTDCSASRSSNLVHDVSRSREIDTGTTLYRNSNLATEATQVNNDTDSIIARYKKLRSTTSVTDDCQLAENSNSQLTIVEGEQSDYSPFLSLEQSVVNSQVTESDQQDRSSRTFGLEHGDLTEKYAADAEPSAVKTRKFTLDDFDFNVSPASSRREHASGIEDLLKSVSLGAGFNRSPLSRNKESPSASPFGKGSYEGRLMLNSFPMSPVTSSLHTDSPLHRRISQENFPDIYGEDESLLVSLSPP